MALKDRFRRLRKGSVSEPKTSPAATANSTPPLRASGDPSPGPATPALTHTPTSRSISDLTTIGGILTQQATNATANGEKKKKKGLFRRKEDPYKHWPDDVYKPHEVPAPKYKRKPDPKHVENLHAFSFGGAAKLVRRLSEQSGVSPGGSKLASPFASRAGSRAPSRLNSAAPSQNPSRHGSLIEGEEGGTSPHTELSGTHGTRPRPGMGRGPSSGRIAGLGVDRVAEEDDEEDTEGMDPLSRRRTVRQEQDRNLVEAQTQSSSDHDMPFTEQELTQALSKAAFDDGRHKNTKVLPS